MIWVQPLLPPAKVYFARDTLHIKDVFLSKSRCIIASETLNITVQKLIFVITPNNTFVKLTVKLLCL